ncbi:hypothetical protein KDK_09820 [Dictyobacter kobayashii]|uniref:Uncharacterized protein n=1 Tax=Dictyobacter kobayashii TaxID=2014872 RepID=A0A402ADR4_9CHLR|nr:hypothetical protein KDK_09820 [Dictyobacter kobayashii]
MQLLVFLTGIVLARKNCETTKIRNTINAICPRRYRDTRDIRCTGIRGWRLAGGNGDPLSRW